MLGPPQGRVEGDLQPFAGVDAGPPPRRSAAARRAARDPRLARVLSAATGGPDAGSTPADPVLAGLRPVVTEAVRAATDAVGQAALVGLLGVVGALTEGGQAWAATMDKDRVDRRVVPLGFDPAAHPDADYDGLPGQLAAVDAVVDALPLPEDAGGPALVHRRRGDGVRGEQGGGGRLRRVGRAGRRGRGHQPHGRLHRWPSGRRGGGPGAGAAGRAQPLPPAAQLRRRLGWGAHRRLQDRARRAGSGPAPAARGAPSTAPTARPSTTTAPSPSSGWRCRTAPRHPGDHPRPPALHPADGPRRGRPAGPARAARPTARGGVPPLLHRPPSTTSRPASRGASSASGDPHRTRPSPC